MSEYFGLRRWRLVKRPRAGWTVMSLYSNMVWHPDRPVEAWCSTAKMRLLCPTVKGRHQCGIWACPDKKALDKQIKPEGPYVEGEARLFDDIYNYEHMSRGLHAEITAFYLPLYRVQGPDRDHDVLDILDHLLTWNVPILERH